jgi:ABC-type phosphate/phosphonate transport system substrate-binding protein
MNRRMGIGLSMGAGLLAAALAQIPQVSSAGDTPRARSVRVGLVSSLFRDTSEPLVRVMLRPFKALMESQTGVSSELVVVKDADGLGNQLHGDQVQLGVFHGNELAWARLKYPDLQPLLIAVNQEPFLKACLVVRRDNKAESYAGLKGQTLALHHRSREHCVLYMERRCVEPGTTPDEFFAEVTKPRDSLGALDDVFGGTAQAAVVDVVDLVAYQKDRPSRAAKLKILQQSEPLPCAVVAYRKGALAQADLDRFRDGMLAAKSNRQGQELLNLCRITSFEAVPDNYDQMLQDVAQAYPPPAPPK